VWCCSAFKHECGSVWDLLQVSDRSTSSDENDQFFPNEKNIPNAANIFSNEGDNENRHPSLKECSEREDKDDTVL
jgi:hypothetical protein